MVSRKEWYARVNDAWPKPLPELTEYEAIRAARRLWRWALGSEPPEIQITSGNRYTWTRRGVLMVNPSAGWDRFVHDLSHLFWRRANRVEHDLKPHEKGHARFELRMRKEVLRRGWLDGKLKPAPKPPKDPKLVRYEAVIASIERWRAKLRRAQNALRKLQTRERYYQRTLVAQ
jgi:hypothetical protein